MPTRHLLPLCLTAVLAAGTTTLTQGRLPRGLQFSSQEPLLDTSAKDVSASLPMLDDYAPDNVGSAFGLERTAGGGWILEDGVFEAHLEGFCLQPGASRGRGDEGYGDAPFRGPFADIIHSILRNRDQHPELTQAQVQSLIWAVLARVPFTEMPAELQRAGRQLLGASDLRRLSTDAARGRLSAALRQRLLDAVPPALRQVFEAEVRLRELFAGGITSYRELEATAVPGGDPSQYSDSGRWSYRADGYFVRYRPSGYQDAFLQFARPGPVVVTRDTLGRIVEVADRAGRSLRLRYDDATPESAARQTPISRTARISQVAVFQPTYGELGKSRSFVWRVGAWTFVGEGGQSDPLFSDSAARAAEDAGWVVQLTSFGQRNVQPQRLGRVQRELASALDLLRVRKGLAALRESDDAPEWTRTQLDLLAQAFQFELCRSLGGCPLPPQPIGDQVASSRIMLLPAVARQSAPDAPPSIDPSNGVAVPPGEDEQRLGRSRAPKGCPPPEDLQKLADALTFQETGAELSRRFITSPRPDGYLRDVEGYENWLRDQLGNKFGGVVERGNATGSSATVNDACVDSPASICKVLNQATAAHEFQHQLDLWNMKKTSEQLTDREAAGLEQRGYERSSSILRKALDRYRVSCQDGL